MIDYQITTTQEYKDYIKALCRLASNWVPRIRKQYADKAIEMYQNETVRKLVIEYGKEVEKRDEELLRNFSFACEQAGTDASNLETSCLNNAEHYGATLKMLFDIKY